MSSTWNTCPYLKTEQGPLYFAFTGGSLNTSSVSNRLSTMILIGPASLSKKYLTQLIVLLAAFLWFVTVGFLYNGLNEQDLSYGGAEGGICTLTSVVRSPAFPLFQFLCKCSASFLTSMAKSPSSGVMSVGTNRTPL